MFWGCKIKDNLPYAVNANGECILNISQICLKEQYSKGKIFVTISSQKEEFVIGVLEQNVLESLSVNLILNLSKGEQQKIFLTGAKGEVHLIGCIMLKYNNQLKKDPKEKSQQQQAEALTQEISMKNKKEISTHKKKEEEKGKQVKEDNSDIDMNEIDDLLKKRKRSLSK